MLGYFARAVQNNNLRNVCRYYEQKIGHKEKHTI